MGRPVILAVDDEEESLAGVEHELRKRYGGDYDIVGLRSASAARARLREMKDDGRPVTLVLADQWMPEMTGIELLASVRADHPAAKRAVLASRLDWSSRPHIVKATGLGEIDGWLPKPTQAPDEHFHRLMTELLDEWSRAHGDSRFVAVRVVGEQWAPRCHELRDLLGRNGVAFEFTDAASAEGCDVLERNGLDRSSLPVVELFTGEVLVDPTNERIAQAFAVTDAPDDTVDVAVVGAGPAGLAAAVYAASEGLSTVILDREAIGGQAGTSSRIRNYLGFPRGVSGAELAVRAFEQAWLFGATPYLMRAATGLRPSAEGYYAITLSDGPEVAARSVVIASGVSYRRLGIPSLEALVGAGVFYGAAVSEAQSVAGQHVYVAGGGNSAGQAAIHLARYADQVSMLVRSESLAASMSSYLIGEIEAAPNIDVRYQTTIVGGSGRNRLETLELAAGASGTVQVVPAGGLFVLIGGEPHTGWLPEEIERDQWGFIVTGTDVLCPGCFPRGWPLERPPMLLETTLPGVFAVGDVRHRSVKRVASAVGEGSVAIQFVHRFLNERPHSARASV